MKIHPVLSLIVLCAIAPAPKLDAFEAFLDGSTLPEAPWQSFLDGEEDQRGETVIVDFLDPVGQTNNQALRLNSGTGANEWFVGAFPWPEVAGAARFRLVEFSQTGKENLLCVTTLSKHLAPSPSLTLVDGRFKLWSYVIADSEIMDIGSADTNFHTIYLYARTDGLVKLWWDGKLLFDGIAPQTNPYDGYFEWGSGSWQFDATDTIDFDWVGYGGVSDLPLAVTTTPPQGAIFHDASAGLNISAVSQPDLAPGVPASGINLTVNGVDRTSDLSVTGTDPNRQATFTGLVPDRNYRLVIKTTDAAGTISSYPLEFDTFRTNHFTFEAEDFNFDGGQFLDTIVLGSAGAADNYIDRVGVEGIDHLELSAEPGTMPHQYRADSLVATERNRDTPRPQYTAGQAIDSAIADFNVASVEAGEWLNYTRTFPPGRYHVYARLANGNFETNFVASLGRVANPTSADQTVSSLGTFRGGLGRGWQTYEFVPLTDEQGQPVAVNLSGVETLRVTAVDGSHTANFYMLVPAVEVTNPTMTIARASNEIVISWEGQGLTLETTDRIGGTWTAVLNAASPYRSGVSDATRFFRVRQAE